MDLWRNVLDWCFASSATELLIAVKMRLPCRYMIWKPEVSALNEPVQLVNGETLLTKTSLAASYQVLAILQSTQT